MWGDGKVLSFGIWPGVASPRQGTPPAGALYPWSVKGGSKMLPTAVPLRPSGLAPAILYY